MLVGDRDEAPLEVVIVLESDDAQSWRQVQKGQQWCSSRAAEPTHRHLAEPLPGRVLVGHLREVCRRGPDLLLFGERDHGRVVVAEDGVVGELGLDGEIRPVRSVVLASPMLSNEALYLLSRLAKKTGGAGAFRVPQGDEEPLPGVDDLALRPDRAANEYGAEHFRYARSDRPQEALNPGYVLIVADEELPGVENPNIAAASAVIVIGTTVPKWAAARTDVVLPTANMAEEEGTFTNLRGRVQRFLQAKAAPGFARPSWWVLADLLSALGERANYFMAKEVFTSLAGEVSVFKGMSYETLGLKGRTVAGGPRAKAGQART